MPHDARAIANLILDIAAERGISLTPLSLQKILYFCQGWWLARYDKPLIAQSFQAWQYGPVIKVVYDAFKHLGAQPIETRAEYMDFAAGSISTKRANVDAAGLELLVSVVAYYGRASAFALVELTHEPDGPWDMAATQKVDSPNGIISNHAIRAHFLANRQSRQN